MARRRSTRPLSDVSALDFQSPPGAARSKRGPRNRPKPNEWYQEHAEGKEAFLRERPVNPGIILEPDREHGEWKKTAPHGDQKLWEVQMFAAFASSSPSVVNQFLNDLQELCTEDYDPKHGWKTNETEWNAALAMVNDIQPQTIREAALAAQMVAVHWATMRLAKDALNNGGMVMERSANLLSKLARTYTMQMEALKRERGEGPSTVRQEIHVTRENHIHYHDNRERGGDGNGTRPQEPRAATVEGRAKMLGHSEGHGQALPSSGDAREEGLPQARRKESRGKAR